MSEWQPIETAPRDGTVIDVWTKWGERMTYVYWSPKYPSRQFAHTVSKGPWVYRDDGYGEYGEGFMDEDGPTHWMPHPEPPK